MSIFEYMHLLGPGSAAPTPVRDRRSNLQVVRRTSTSVFQPSAQAAEATEVGSQSLSTESALLEQILNELRWNSNQAGSATTFTVRTSTVVTAGNAIQGPEFLVRPGFELLIRQRKHTGSPRGYVSSSKSGAQSSSERIELNDDGYIILRVDNMNVIWLDASENNVTFELISIPATA